MRQEKATRKKYAAVHKSWVLTRSGGATAESTELLAQMEAVADQVARLRRAAKRMSRRPRVQTVSAQAVDQMTQEEWEADQQHKKAIFAGLIAKAQAHVHGPVDSAARQAYRDSPLDEIIVEKFRQQGFNL